MKRIILFILTILVGISFEPVSAQVKRGNLKKIHEERKDDRSRELTREGIILFKAGKINKAAEAFEEAVKLDERNARAHAFLAQIAFLSGNDERARNQAHLALTINPRLPRAHYVLGRVMIRNGKELAGFDHLRKAAALADQSGDEIDRAELDKFFAALKEKNPKWFQRLKEQRASRPVSPALPSSQPVPPVSDMKPAIAVFVFEDTNPQTEGAKWGVSFSEMVTTAMIGSGKFKVVERTQLNKILEEQALGQSGALDPQTAMVVGQLMNLDLVILGSISQLNNRLETDARIIHVITGEAITAANASAPSPDHLRDAANQLAENFVSRLGSIQAAVQSDSLKK